MKKKCTIIRHRVDLDGTGSALVVDKWIREHSDGYEEPEHIGWNYGDDIPTIGEGLVFLVDISFPADDMKKLYKAKGNEVIWIDHHISHIEASEKQGYDTMEGLRYVGNGACELCWEYLYEGVPVPRFIQYLSAYDTWQKERFNWTSEVLPLQFGLKLKYGLAPQSYTAGQVFERLLDENDDLMNMVIGTGKTILDYNISRFKSIVKAYSFDVLVAGKYKGICTLCTDFGSTLYTHVIGDYEVFVCANRKTGKNGEPIFTVSFYSEPGRCELNLASYAENWGGGGHRCAAGCTVSKEDFMRLVGEGKI